MSRSAVAGGVIRDLPPGAEFVVTVAGASMEPVLRAGDVIRAVRYSVAGPAVRVGDLAVVELPEAGLVVHRVLWTAASHVRTRGDATRKMDAPVPMRDVLGRTMTVTRAGRDVTPAPALRWLAWFPRFAAAVAERVRGSRPA